MEYKEVAIEDLQIALGQFFRETRENLGMTQRQAAKHCNMTQARISDIELGKVDMHLSILQRLAYAYGFELEIGLAPLEEESSDDAEVPA